MRILVSTLLTLTMLSLASPALARKVTVEITNLTNAIYYTPLLIVAHSKRHDLFEPGEKASEALQKMAEGGDIADLANKARDAGAIVVENPANGFLGPGATTKLEFDARRRHKKLSVVAMILPSNDGFVGLDSASLPADKGKRTLYLLGYDAGTETNDELINTNGGGMPGIAGIPGDPSGLGGSGGTGVSMPDTVSGSDHNSAVHVHRNIVGDTSPTGGISDLDSTAHRWQNPIARIVVTVR